MTGSDLAAWRKLHGMTQSDVAFGSGVATITVSYWETKLTNEDLNKRVRVASMRLLSQWMKEVDSA